MAPEFSNEDVEAIVRSARRKARRETRWQRRGLVALVLVLIAMVAIAVTVPRMQRDDAEAGRVKEQQAKDAVAGTALSLADQVQAACRAGGAEAKALAKRGLCGQATATKDAVEDAVDTSTPTAAIVPVPGRPGRDGPTLNQVIAAYRDDVDRMIREAINARLADAVAAYCATRNQCAGQKGESITGAKGADAPRITGISCDGTTGRFSFSDGSTISVSGMCAASGGGPSNPDTGNPDPAPEPEVVEPAPEG